MYIVLSYLNISNSKVWIHYLRKQLDSARIPVFEKASFCLVGRKGLKVLTFEKKIRVVCLVNKVVVYITQNLATFRVLCWDFSHQQCFKLFKLLHQNLLVKWQRISQKGMNISEWVNKIILLQSPNSSHIRPRLTDSLAKLQLITRSWNNQFHNPETKWWLSVDSAEWNHIIQPLSSWWFQPIWKILVKLDHFPK